MALGNGENEIPQRVSDPSLFDAPAGNLVQHLHGAEPQPPNSAGRNILAAEKLRMSQVGKKEIAERLECFNRKYVAAGEKTVSILILNFVVCHVTVEQSPPVLNDALWPKAESYALFIFVPRLAVRSPHLKDANVPCVFLYLLFLGYLRVKF